MEEYIFQNFFLNTLLPSSIIIIKWDFQKPPGKLEQ